MDVTKESILTLKNCLTRLQTLKKEEPDKSDLSNRQLWNNAVFESLFDLSSILENDFGYPNKKIENLINEFDTDFDHFETYILNFADYAMERLDDEIKNKSEEPKWYFNVRSGSTFHDNDGAHIIAKDLSIPIEPHDFAGHPDDMAHIIFKDGVIYNAPCMDGSTYAFESEMYVGTSPENDGCDISKEAKFDILEEEIVELEEDTGLDEL